MELDEEKERVEADRPLSTEEMELNSPSTNFLHLLTRKKIRKS